MRGLFKNKPFIIMLIAIVLLVIVIILTSGERNMTVVENAAGSAITPAAGIFDYVTGGVGDFLGSIFMPAEKRQQLEDLQKRIAELESQIQNLEEQRLENERLKGLLDFKEENSHLNFVAARVIAKSPGYWFDSFTINAGSNKGIEKDMAVVTGDGLVGRVVETGGNWSKVVSIIDGQSNVSAIIERTRDYVMIHGAVQLNEQDSYCTMHYLSEDAVLLPGDKVRTSGLGGIFEKGLLIGEVMEAGLSGDGESRNVTVKTAVDFLHVEEVMVVVAVDSDGENQ